MDEESNEEYQILNGIMSFMSGREETKLTKTRRRKIDVPRR